MQTNSGSFSSNHARGGANPPSQQSGAPILQTNRNFDHLDYDENLYDFMKSQIPFYINSSNEHINTYILNESRGLEKQQVLNIYYNDTVGKREFVNELLMSTILMKQWGQGDNCKDLENTNELSAIIIDIQGQFSCYKFIEKLREYYDSRKLYDTVETFNENGRELSERELNDKQIANKFEFVKQVMQNLYIFSCFDAVEFNLTVRSLASFLKKQKNIGLIVVDGIHFIESVEYYSTRDKSYASESANQDPKDTSGLKLKKGKANNVLNMSNFDIPTGDDFLGVSGQSAAIQSGKTSNVSGSSNCNTIRHSFNLKRGAKSGSKLDYNQFDNKLIDRAIILLNEYQKIYQFAFVSCLAKPNLRKTSDMLEQVMTRGLLPEQAPKLIQKESDPNNQQEAAMRLNGYNMDIILEGQIQAAEINDNQLRESIKSLRQNEILILRGDRQNSLMPRSDPKKIHDGLLTQHLSCCILPQTKYSGNDRVVQEQVPYVKRYLGLYVLYKVDVNRYKISDDVIKSFYF
eukprot:403340741